MARIHITDGLAVDRMTWCYDHQQWMCPLNCPTCEKFPCAAMTKETIRTIRSSPLFDKEVIGLKARRRTLMFIAEFTDGSFRPIEIDLQNPDVRHLSEVVEVHEIKKTYVPTLTLKPKPKEARDAVKSAAANTTTTTTTNTTNTTPVKRRGRKPAAKKE